MTDVRKGQAPDWLPREEFRKRFMESFYDPAFDKEKEAIARLEEIAWEGYKEERKAPRTVKAGPGFARPDYDLSAQWVETRDRLLAAEKRQKDAATPSRVLVVCGSSRNDGTCPGEMSKTFRLAKLAEETLKRASIETDFLDLSRLTSELRAGASIRARRASPPRSRSATGRAAAIRTTRSNQVDDWMAEIYERWVAAHARDPHHAGELVPHLEPDEADDRPARVRRRRQSRSDDQGEGPRGGEGAGDERLAVSQAPRRAASTDWWCTATSRASKARAARCPTGSTGWA